LCILCVVLLILLKVSKGGGAEKHQQNCGAHDSNSRHRGCLDTSLSASRMINCILLTNKGHSPRGRRSAAGRVKTTSDARFRLVKFISRQNVKSSLKGEFVNLLSVVLAVRSPIPANSRSSLLKPNTFDAPEIRP